MSGPLRARVKKQRKGRNLVILMKVITAGLLAFLVAAMPGGIGISTTTNAQENQLASKYPKLVEARNNGKLSNALFENALQFEENYPRLVRALERRQIDYKLFRTAFRGVRNKDQGITKLARAFQDRKIRLSDFLLQMEVFEEGARLETACSEDWCDDRARVYYTGCRNGGAYAFECFVLTEQYMCICMNFTCSYGNDCGVIPLL